VGQTAGWQAVQLPAAMVNGQWFDMLFGAGEAHGMTWRDRQSMAE
jgi:hypothetical protein